MPQPLGESMKRALFRDLVAEYPDEDPVKLAEKAGFARPAEAIQRMHRSAVKKDEKIKAAKLTDRERSVARLRRVVEHGNDSQAVHAARALLEASPAPVGLDGTATLVVFRGREGVANTQALAADVAPDELAAAIAHIRSQRTPQTQIEQHAVENAIDPDELALAWELYSHSEARAAALRVYLLAQPAENTPSEGSDDAEFAQI